MDKKAQKRAWEILDAQLNGNLGQTTARGIRAWFIGEAHEEAKFLALEDHWNKHVTESHNPGAAVDADFAEIAVRLGFPEREYAKPQTVRPAPKVTPLRRRMMFRVAAVLLPFLVIAGAAYLWVDRAGNATEEYPIAEVVVTADSGEIATVELSDGSTVRVESGHISHIKDFGKERRVEMEGEAYFNVAKDSTHVFTVHTEYLNIRVLGTEFKVNTAAGEDISTVHLYHGSILVEAGQQSFVMTPGQILTYHHPTGKSELSRMAIGNLQYEEMPGLVFDGSSLEEAFQQITRQYGVPVIIEGELDTGDSILKVDLRYARSINSVMNILSTATGRFTYEITDDKVIVYRK